MEKETIISADYLIHDISLRFITNNQYIYSSINTILEFFFTREQLGYPDINFTLFGKKNDADFSDLIPNGSRLLYTPSEKDRFDIKFLGVKNYDIYVNTRNSVYYVDLGDLGFLSYRPEKGTADGYIQNPESISPNIISSFIFMFILNQLLKAKDYFPIHCSAVEKEGKGILLPGFSGSGKTTSCIAFIRRGYGFLGDDRQILCYRKNGGVKLLSFPEPINVTNKTINFFSELVENKLLHYNNDSGKQRFPVEELYPGSVRDVCIPQLILYPEISADAKSSLYKLPKSEALSLFLPHSLLVLDKKVAGRHFNIIGDLIHSTDCYHLKLGSNIHDLPELVESIL